MWNFERTPSPGDEPRDDPARPAFTPPPPPPAAPAPISGTVFAPPGPEPVHVPDVPAVPAAPEAPAVSEAPAAPAEDAPPLAAPPPSGFDPIFAFDQQYARIVPPAAEPALPHPATTPELEPEPEPEPEREPEPAPEPEPVDSRPPAERFVSMLGELPATVNVFAPKGGVMSLAITGIDPQGRVTGFGPREFMQKGYETLIELRDAGGAGYDIAAVVEEAFFDAGERGELHMSVTSITRRLGERETARVPVSEVCEATVLYSTVLPVNATMQARIADVSMRGLSLTLERVPAVGDTLRLRGTISGRLMIVRVRVARVDAAAFGRYRVGCEITQITATDRAHLVALARAHGTVDAGGVELRRRPVEDAVLRRRTEQSALSQRLRNG